MIQFRIGTTPTTPQDCIRGLVYSGYFRRLVGPTYAVGLGVSEYLSVHVAGSGADLFRPGIQVVAGKQEFPSVRELFKDLGGCSFLF